MVSDYEGQAIVSVYYNGADPDNTPQISAAPVMKELKRLLTQCGELKAFHTLPPTQNHVREFRVEFYSADAVDVALDVVNNETIIYVSHSIFPC